MAKVSTPISIVGKSHNSKLGLMSATYAAQRTCPTTCPFRGDYDNAGGCYAEHEVLRFSTLQRNRVADNARATLAELARAEAEGIRKLARRRGRKLALRVHVVGDCSTPDAAQQVGSAMCDYVATTGKPAYTYSHSWRDIDRSDWNGAAVLASCESVADAVAARERGYHVALVVAEHTSDRAYDVEGVGRVVPCLNQTRGLHCAECKICFRGNVNVAFAPHSGGAERVRSALR